MTVSERKDRARRGFTLAELLIVVAVIAILVAVAAPIFFGSLDKAKEAVKDANIRAIRAIAVNEILLHSEEVKYKLTGESTGWEVMAYINENGQINNDKIYIYKCKLEDAREQYPGDIFYTEGADGSIIVILLLAPIDLSAPSGG